MIKSENEDLTKLEELLTQIEKQSEVNYRIIHKFVQVHRMHIDEFKRYDQEWTNIKKRYDFLTDQIKIRDNDINRLSLQADEYRKQLDEHKQIGIEGYLTETIKEQLKKRDDRYDRENAKINKEEKEYQKNIDELNDIISEKRAQVIRHKKILEEIKEKLNNALSPEEIHHNIIMRKSINKRLWELNNDLMKHEKYVAEQKNNYDSTIEHKRWLLNESHRNIFMTIETSPEYRTCVVQYNSKLENINNLLSATMTEKYRYESELNKYKKEVKMMEKDMSTKKQEVEIWHSRMKSIITNVEKIKELIDVFSKDLKDNQYA